MSVRMTLSVTFALGLMAGVPPATASSHREAPFAARNPKTDGTDLYAFRSYEVGRAGYLTLIANYQPFQRPEGGPLFHPLDPEGSYEIHLDNNGDAREDITFRFLFKNQIANGGEGLALNVGGKTVPVPVLQMAPLTAGSDANLNLVETYTVQIVRGDRRAGTVANLTNVDGGAAELRKPTDYIGGKTFGDPAAYEAYARAHLYEVNVPQCAQPARVFVGQRRESFAANQGALYDLLNFPVGVLVGSPDAGLNSMDGNNVTTLALEVPITCVTGTGPIVGAWTSAHLRGLRPRRFRTDFPLPNRGIWTQVSRLGGPLINALFVGLKDKDRFNGSHPADDAVFSDYVTHPTLPEILEIEFGSVGLTAPNTFPRTDLVATFLTGFPGVNNTATPAEMLRLNTLLPATPRSSQNQLGALACFDRGGALDISNPGCDPAGFPNGRRPGDDVVDIVLRLAVGYLLPPAESPSGGLPLVDGAYVDGSHFDDVFPYLRTPVPPTLP